MLDRNVKLEFEMTPADADNQNICIVTALSRFKTRVEFKGPEGEMEFEASGEVVLRDDGRILVIHETSVTFEGDQSRGHFHASSGILLKPGQRQVVSRMGEKALVIGVAYVDDEDG